MPTELLQAKSSLPQLELSGAEEVVRAQSLLSLATYAEAVYPGYQAARFHRYLAQKLEDCYRRKIRRLCISFPPQHGKLLADSTPVFTPQGWKTHGELKVGHCVFHPNGNPVRVVAVSEPDVATLEVEFTNGAKITAHEKHEWILSDRSKHRDVLLETRQIKARELITGINGKRGSRVMLRLPFRSPLVLPQSRLQMNPYVLGVWLGDGNAAAPNFCYATPDAAICEKVASLGYEETWRSVHKDTGVNYVGLGRWFGRCLESMGVKNNKHIPASYLRASDEQRLQLLAGLIDTDGSVDQKNGRVRFVTCSDRLCDDVSVLIRTLGWEPTVWTAAPCTSSSGIIGRQPVHYVAFQPDRQIPCALKRKQTLILAMKRRVGIVAVREVSPVPGRCIQVDSPDGLYLVGRELIPTHNSRLTSIIFPSWAMTRDPRLRFLQAGYSSDLSAEFCREARSLVSSERYLQLFPELIDPNVNRQNDWRTKRGGQYFAPGIGGQAVGRGFDFILLDDPHKDREDAESKGARDKVWTWILSSALNRLTPDGVIICIQTRWHLDDTVGRFTAPERSQAFIDAGMQDLNFEVVSLPAVCESPEKDPLGRQLGDALWPEVRNARYLKGMELNLTKKEWNSQYQQRPNAPTGNLTNINDIQIIDRSEVPADLKLTRGWDLALGEEQSSDYSAGALGGIKVSYDSDGRKLRDVYLVHIHRGKKLWPEQKKTIIRFAKMEAVGWRIGVEAVSAWKIGTAELRESLSGDTSVFDVPATKSKPLRAQAWFNAIEAHRFFMVRGDWNADFLDELEQFPAGVHDDQVDAVSTLYETVDKKFQLVLA